MTLDMSHHAVIVAAGTGSRAGGDRPKQFQPLAGRPVLRWSVETLVSSSITDIIVVIAPGDERLAEDAMEGLSGWRLALGQATRSLSVQAGLALIDGADDDIVLIHDAARPFLTRQHVEALGIPGDFDDQGVDLEDAPGIASLGVTGHRARAEPDDAGADGRVLAALDVANDGEQGRERGQEGEEEGTGGNHATLLQSGRVGGLM